MSSVVEMHDYSKRSDVGPPEPTEIRRFAESEYGSARNEIAARSKLDVDFQKNSLLIIAALIATACSTTISLEPRWVAIVAAAVVAFYALLQKRRNRIWCTRLGAYSKKLEDFLYKGGEQPEGWEKFIKVQIEAEKEAFNENRLNWWGLGGKWPVGTSSTQLDYTFWILTTFATSGMATLEMLR